MSATTNKTVIKVSIGKCDTNESGSNKNAKVSYVVQELAFHLHLDPKNFSVVEGHCDHHAFILRCRKTTDFRRWI